MCLGPELAALASMATAEAGMTAAAAAPEMLAATALGDAGIMGMTAATAAPGAGAFELATAMAPEMMPGLLTPPTSIPNALGSKMAALGKGSGNMGLLNAGMNMMEPQEQEQRPISHPSPMQGQAPGAIPKTYGQGLLGMDPEEEKKKRLRAMGYPV